jgi:hypothetical protein
MAGSRRRIKVPPGGSRTVRGPGGGSTRVKNGRDGKIDIQVKLPKK